MANLDELITQLAQEAEAVTPAPHPFRLAGLWLLAALVYLVVTLAASGLRPDLAHSLQQPWLLAELAALLAVLVASALASAVLAFPDLHQKRGWVMAAGAAFVGLWGVIALAWLADTPPAPLPEHSYQCTLSITAMTLLPAFITFYVMRRYACTQPQLAGSVALLFAFSVGALWLRLHEVNDSVWHVIVWHYLPMLLISALGWSLGRRLLKW